MQSRNLLHNLLPISSSPLCRRQMLGVKLPKPLHLENKRADLHMNNDLTPKS